MDVQKAKRFITAQARKVELSEYRCLFEGGPRGDFVSALGEYQNPDGGFGNALEPDNWNPNSTPITTNDAIMRLFYAGAMEEGEGLLAGAQRYLLGGDGFIAEKRRWAASVESTLQYPHAVWWEPGDGDVWEWNPTISLAAFLVCRGAGEPWGELVREGFRWLSKAEEIGSDQVKCFMAAHGLLERQGIRDLIDLDAGREAVRRAVGLAICHEPEKYGVEYVAGPETFFHGEGYMPQGIEELIEADLLATDRLQMEDGGFDITWQWYTPYEREYKTARDWWRPRVTMERLGFYLKYN